MIARLYTAFLVGTAAWLGAAFLLYDAREGAALAAAIVWWGLLVMTAAAVYYALQVGSVARGWLARDLAINTALTLVLAAALLDGAHGWARIGLEGAGWIAFGAALLHPVLVDRPHHRRRESSPVPRAIPGACFLIDWTLAALVLVGLVLL